MESKPFHKTWLGILLLLAFWPFTFSYWIWKKNWNLKLKLGLIIPLWFFIILIGLAKPQEQLNNKNVLGETTKSKSSFGNLNTSMTIAPTGEISITPIYFPTIIISSITVTQVIPTITVGILNSSPTNIPTITHSDFIPTSTVPINPSPTQIEIHQSSPTQKIYIPSPTIYIESQLIEDTGTYICNCSKTCKQISSCAEAQYQLNVCGCKQRDADHDGIACDSAPLHCQN